MINLKDQLYMQCNYCLFNDGNLTADIGQLNRYHTHFGLF